jgi:AcrR family transcriptional regulator
MTAGTPGAAPVVKQARSALSTQRLLTAAAELIGERGYNATTLAAIGERAGYSHGMVTRRFGSKEGLLAVLIERMVSDWSQHELREAVGDETGVPALQAMIGSVRRAVRRAPVQMRALYGLTFEALQPTPGLRERMVEVHREQRRQLADMVRAGVPVGTIRADADPAGTATMVIAGLRGIAFQWLLEPADVDIDAALAGFSEDLGRLLSPGG